MKTIEELKKLYEQRDNLRKDNQFTFTIDKEIEEAEMDIIQSRMKELAEAAIKLFEGIESDYSANIIHSMQVGTRVYVRPKEGGFSVQ